MVFLIGSFFNVGVTPEIRGQELGGVLEGSEASLKTVSGSLRATSGAGVAILDTGELEDLLGLGLTNDTGTSGTGDKSDSHGTTLTGDLAGNGVGSTDLITPVTFSHGGDVQLGVSDGTLDGTLDFLVELEAQTDVAGLVTNQDDGFEAGSLTGTGHLLDRLQLHHFFLEAVLEEIVNDLGFFHGDGELEDFIEGGDLAVLDETAQFGHGLPFVDLVLGATALILSAFAETSASTSAFFSFVSHIFLIKLYNLIIQ